MLCVGGGSAIATTEDFVAIKQEWTMVMAAREIASGSASAAAI
jgi:hypothetical protein